MIFGKNAPKFISGSTTVLLDYVVITKNEPQYEYIEQESEIDGSKELIKKGKHWSVELRMNLYKYADQAKVQFDILNNLEGAKGSFYLHRDGSAYKDSDGVDVPFVLREVIPFYLTSLDFRDGLILKFESTKFVDLSQGSVVVPLLENITMSNDY